MSVISRFSESLAPQPTPEEPGEFTKGLRSGLSTAGGQLNALAGGAAEALGRGDIAAERYAAARAAQEEAAAQAPRVSSPSSIRSLRDLGDFVAGSAGAMLPTVGAGAAAALATRGRVNPALAFGGAMLPTSVGRELQAQQDDPVAAARPLDQRLASAGLTGTARAAAESVLPAHIGGKILGTAAGQGLRRGTGEIVARNAAEAVGLGAGSEVASELLGQGAATALNTERDRSQDVASLRDAALGGAIMGVPFGAAGAAGDLAHRPAASARPGDPSTQGPAAAPAALDAPTPSTPPTPNTSMDAAPLGERAREAAGSFGERMRTVFARGGDARGAEEMAAGRDLVQPRDLEGRSPEEQARVFDDADRSMMQKAQAWGEELLNGNLSEEQRARLAQAMSDLQDVGNRSVVATMKVAQDARARATKAIDDFTEAMLRTRGRDEAGADRSDVDTNLTRAVREVLVPELEAVGLSGDDQAIQKLGGNIRTLLQSIEEGRQLDPRAYEALSGVFGQRTRDVMSALSDVVHDADDVGVKERFFTFMNDVADHESSQRGLSDLLGKSLLPEVADTMTTREVDNMVSGLRQLVAQQDGGNAGRAEREYNERLLRSSLAELVGESKVSGVLEAFAKDAQKRSRGAAKGTQDDRAPGEVEGMVADGTLTEGEDLGKQFETRYYGTGKDRENPGLVRVPKAHREKFGGSANSAPVFRLKKLAREENPDASTAFVSAREYAKEKGWTDAQLMEATGGKPDDFGIIAATRNIERTSRSDADGDARTRHLTDADLENVRLDTTKTSHLDSPSRIDTDKRGVTLDARRLTRMMDRKLEYNETDGQSAAHRSARMFMEGLAAAMDKAQAKVRDLPDSTVIDFRGTTVADIKKLGFLPAETADGGQPMFMAEDNSAAKRVRLNRAEVQIEKLAEKAAPLIAKEKDGTLTALGRAQLSKLRETAAKIRRSMRSDEASLAREDASQRLDSVRSGKDEFSLDDNIHMQELQAEVSGRDIEQPNLNLDGTPRRHNTADRTLWDGKKLTKLAIDSLNNRADRMARSAAAANRQLSGQLRDLINNAGKMTPEDQQVLAASIRAQKVSEWAGAARSLHRKYITDDTPDPKGPGSRRPKSDAGQTADMSAQKPGTEKVSLNDRTAARKYIDKTLGPAAEVEFKKLFHAGDYQRVDGRDFIRISAHALDPMGTAFHESMHAFMARMREAGVKDIADTLNKAASSASVLSQLRRLLKDEPDALKQIENNIDERAAYMYQFWAAGHLKVGDGATGVLSKIRRFIHKMLGTWSNDERAERIMEYFSSGEYQANAHDRSAVQRALVDAGRNQIVEKFRQVGAPLGRLSDAVFATGSGRVRSYNNPAMSRIMDLVKRDTTSAGRDQGFIPAARASYLSAMNEFMGHFDSPEALNRTWQTLQRGEKPDTPEGRLQARQIRKLLDKMYEGMTQAGIKLGDAGYGKDYLPRVWDIDYISKHTAEMRAMLEKYTRDGRLKGNPDSIIASLMAQGGSELDAVTTMPGMAHMKERVFAAITPEDAAPFLVQNGMEVLSSYVAQATRRTEWAKRFGGGNEVLAQLRESATDKYGATKEQMAVLDKYLAGVDGSLGAHIDPGLRRMFGNIQTYQNIRLLPFGVFSSMVDSLGIKVRGGTWGDAFKAFGKGFTEIPRGFKDMPAKDVRYELAETLGVIENATLMSALGSMYTYGTVGRTARKINDTYFKYNLMEQYNTSMRVAATEAAVRFIKRHAAGESAKHSERFLAELGLKASDVKMRGEDMLITEQDFRQAGLSAADAQKAAVRMRAAVNKWVDGATLRPDAADVPIWMNDPHYMLVAHLKRFVFAFQKTILARVVHEAQHQNYAPAAALGSYVPVMIAADFARGMLQGGGQQPEWKQGWGVEDYLWNGVQRAGLLGVGQFHADVFEDVQRGGIGIGALAGPTIDQLTDGVQVLGGRGDVGNFAVKALPAHAVLKAVDGGVDKSDPKFSS